MVQKSILSPAMVVQKQQQKAAKGKVVKRFFLFAHLLAYIVVNIFLYVLNYRSNYNDSRWHIFVLAAWGTGLLFHCLFYSLSNHSFHQGSTGVFLFHLGSFLIVIPLLVFRNMFDGVSLSLPLTWFWYVPPFWASLLLSHFAVYIYFRIQPLQIPPQSSTSKHHHWQILGAHIIGFAVMNICLYFYNVWVGYGIKWHIYVLTGWGLGVLIHSLFVTIAALHLTNNAQKIFFGHIGLFVLINLYTIFISNFDGITVSIPKLSDLSWSWYMITGWGVGLCVHFLGILVTSLSFSRSHSKGFLTHLKLYLIVIGYLVFLNLFDGDTLLSFSHLSWVWYPLGFWGLAVILHFLFGFINRKTIDEQVDEELQKMTSNS
jgi:2TM domain-containing protein